MIITDSFDVDAPVDQVWSLLKDVPRVATCIPNAKITEVVDDRNYKAEVGVKVGPVAVSYKATIVIDTLDDAAHRASLNVKGAEAKGRGGVTARVTYAAEARSTGTHVTLETDAAITGVIATVGGRLIEGIAKATTAKFADNLAKLLKVEA